MKIKTVCVVEIFKGIIDSITTFKDTQAGMRSARALLEENKKKFMKEHGRKPFRSSECYIEDSEYECVILHSL